MKIISRKEFLQCPRGTVYQEYTPHITESCLSIKCDSIEGDNGYIDWWYQPLDSVSASERSDNHLSINLYNEVRDGTFDDNQLYIVWEFDEVIELINRLREII